MLNANSSKTGALQVRRATWEDWDALEALRRSSLEKLQAPFLKPTQLRTLFDYTPLDPALIEDGTYYVIETGNRIAASGGWSRRAALYRRPGETPRADRTLDPACDPAIVRAMYTHPDFARIGLGSVLLATAETSIRLAGFARAELLATPTGRKLYQARGWRVIESVVVGPADGTGVTGSRMGKAFCGA